MHSDRKDIAKLCPPRKGIFDSGNGPQLSIFLQTRTTLPRASAFAYQANQKGDLVVRGWYGCLLRSNQLQSIPDFRPPVTGAQELKAIIRAVLCYNV